MGSKILTVDEFKSLMRREVEAICKDEGFNYDKETDRGQGFQRWCSNLIAQHEGFDEEDQIDNFTSNDLKVDFIAENIDEKTLYIAQTKFVSIQASPPLVEAEVNDFFSRHELFSSGKWVSKNSNDVLQAYVSDYLFRLADGWQLHYYFMSTGRASERVSTLVQEKEVLARRDYQGLNYHLLDIYGLKEYHIEAQTLEAQITESVQLQFQKGRAIVMERPRRTLVATMKGNSLVSLYRKERERMFAYNIRSFLGRKGINKDIARTAEAVPDEFFYYNNGVSAICTRFDYDESTGLMKAENFQVINGAQTIGSLRQVPHLSPDVEVLIRITEGESVKTERGFNANVIKYNNTQNIIKSSDFRSNDPIQLWLEKHFNELKPRGALERRIQYLRKRSGRRASNADTLRLEELAKIRYVWVAEPTRAIADPKSLWAYSADGGFYEVAFGVGGELEDFWPGSEFDETVLAVVAYWSLEDRISVIVKKDRRKIWVRRLRYFALKLFQDFIQIRQISVSELLRSASTFKITLDEFWRQAYRDLVYAYTQAVEQDKTTVFALARSETRWRNLQAAFRTYMSGVGDD